MYDKTVHMQMGHIFILEADLTAEIIHVNDLRWQFAQFAPRH